MILVLAAFLIGSGLIHSPCLATNSLIVRFNTGNPYAFPDYEFTGNKAAAIPAVSQLNTTYSLTYYRALWRSGDAPLSNTYRLDFPDDADIEEIQQAYAACGAVVFAEQDALIYALAQPQVIHPSDYWYNHTTNGLNNHECVTVSGDSLGWRLWHLTAARVNRAWAITTGDSSVVVAIIDSSFDIDHPELAPVLYWNHGELGGTVGADDDSNGWRDDVCGLSFYGLGYDSNVKHDRYWWQRWGCPTPRYADEDTNCARCFKALRYYSAADSQYCLKNDELPPSVNGFGAQRHGLMMSTIISSAANDNGSHRGDIVGYNWRTKILPLKIGNELAEALRDTLDWSSVAKLSAALEALEYVRDAKVNHGVNIRALNMSMTADLGGDFTHVPPGSFNSLSTLIHDIRAAGIVPVGGAGNRGRSFPVLPCRIPDCLCAAAVYPDENHTKWTDLGPDGAGASNYGVAGTDSVNGVPYGGVDVCAYTKQRVTGAPTKGYHYGAIAPSFELWEVPGWGFCTYDTGIAFVDTSDMHIEGATPMMTSGATAQVTGLVALVASAYPDLTPDQIEGMIKRGAVPADPAYGDSLGAGAIDAYRTLTLWGNAPDTTISGKVYVGASVVIPSGKTMTIEAGTEIFVAPDEAAVFDTGSTGPLFWVGSGGSLVVQGTAENPVKFHSWAVNDTIGNWEGIYVSSGGSLSMSHAVIKHATIGITTGSHDVLVQNTRIEACATGVKCINADMDTARFYGVSAVGCTKGFHVMAGIAEFDSCRADSNTYGYYVESASTLHLHNGSSASHNSLDGIYLNAICDIGPEVWALSNGRHGLYVVKDQTGTAVQVNELYSENNEDGAGICVYYTQRVDVTSSALRNNYDNVYVKYQGRMTLGDVALSRGRNNAITNPGRYHVANFVSGVTLKAEDCYWGYCDEGIMPVISTYGSIDVSPYLCSDPMAGKSLGSKPIRQENWASKNYPNPFNPTTRIDYYVAQSGDRVNMMIYDVAGRRVRVLMDEPQTRGEHWVAWNGSDDRGRAMSGGVYFYVLKIGGQQVASGKMSLIK